MSTITTRAGKGSPLTNNEVDANFTNLNNDKLESADLSGYAELTGATFTGEVEATGFNGDLTGAILFKGQAGEALTKGDPVYISGISGNKTVVSKADANDASKMPCFGIVDATVSANADCSVVTFGTLQGLDTSSFSEGDELFVSDTGALTTTAPTGESSQIQKIGKVTRSHASAGSIKVMGAGRTNAVPNLNDGQFFLGNGSNQAVSADFTTSVLGEISAGTGIGISASGVISNTSPDQTVSLTGGTGISTSGTYPNFTITNDSPDQTVSLTGAGTTTVSGTYPNFTITGAGTTYTAGTGLSLTGTEFANTAPDQTVVLTGAGATSISGTYPNFTISSTDSNTTYTAGTGITLSGTTFSLTDTNAKLNLTGGTLTGALSGTTAQFANVGVGASPNVYGLYVYHTDNYEAAQFQTNQGGSLARFTDLTASIEIGVQSGKPVIRTGNTARLTVDGANVQINSGALQMGSTTVIDSSRNLTNIGTISSGAITTNGPVNITGNTSYVGNYGYSTLVLQDTSGYTGINFRHGNKNWLVRKNGVSDDMEFVYSDDASAANTGTYTERFIILHDGGFDFKGGNLTNINAITSTGVATLTRGNGSVGAPNTANHDTGTRIELYNANATAWYAIGIENDTMWFNSDNHYRFYTDAVSKVDFDSSGVVNAVGGYKVNGTTVIDSAREIKFTKGSSGILASRTGFSDFIGYNPSYGSYIGGGANNSNSWIYSGGYISANGVHTLWHSGNDGSGSGLDADTVDGQHETAFVRVSTGLSSDLNSSALYRAGMFGWHSSTSNKPSDSYGQAISIVSTGSSHNNSSNWITQLGFGTGQNSAYFRSKTNAGGWGNWRTFWHTGNDGSGSGLDADTVDGIHASSFLRSDALTYSSSNIGRANHHLGHLVGSYNNIGGNSGVPNPIYSIGTNYLPTATGLSNFYGVGFAHPNLWGSGKTAGWGLYTTDAGNVTFTAGYSGGTNGIGVWSQGKFVSTPQGTLWGSSNDGSGSGLDADTVDGYNTSTSATANTVVVREGSGHIYGNYILGSYFNASSGNNENPTIGQVWTQSTGDNYLRKSTPAHFKSQLGLWHTGNDGSGSGLDADLLDGNHASAFTSSNDFKWRGTNNLTSTTTSALKTELLNRDVFDSYVSAFKTGWSYAGNANLTDAGRLTELAGTSWLTWTDNSADNVQGNFTALVIAPTTGGSANKAFIYNDQGSSYSPSWREIWTSASDGSGSGLDADTLRGTSGDNYFRKDIEQTVSANILFANSTTAKRGISGTMSDNDQWFVGGAGTGSNAGYLEISTGDDGQTSGSAEYIYVRQYGPGSPLTGTLTRTAALLDNYGNTYFPGNVTAYYSDERLKTKTGNITNAIEKVQSLSGFYYVENELAKQHGYSTETQQVGLSAQEVKAVLPEAVSLAPFDRIADEVTNDSVSKSGEEYLTVDYSRLVPLLIESIKELKSEVDDLKTQLETK